MFGRRPSVSKQELGTIVGVMGDIFRATEEGNEGEVIRLLDADPALLERENDDGDRPLAVAGLSGQLGVVRLLIERSANINATGDRGYTALHMAAEQGTEEIVALLLNKGAHANSSNQYGETPLMRACGHDHLGVVKMLVQHLQGQGLNGSDTILTLTALHWAANGGHDEVVRFLLLAGADPTIRDNEGRTPRALAEENDDDERSRQRRARCVAVFQVRPLTC
jgi:ankyrin repeat protein